jgi:glycosyltransferase involved in cell wall biosynthesis
VNDREVMHKSKGDLMRQLTASLRSAFIRSVESTSRGRFDTAIIINPYLFDAMSDLTGKQYRIISNPVDEVFFTTPKRVANPEGGYRFLYAGEVSALKNILALIHIVSALVHRGVDVRLDIVGPFVDQDYLQQCRAAIEAMKLSGFVTFHGRVHPEDIAAWMDRSDILLLASKQETAPMVVAEAHCRGLPVAAPRAFGLVSMISEGVDGIFLDGPSTSDDATRIADFLNAGSDRDSIRQTAIRKYEIRTIIEKTIEAYEDALCSRAGQSLPIVAHAGRQG